MTSHTGSVINHAIEISKFIKDNSTIPVCWGGVHASLLPQQTLENPYIDFLVEGEGEETFSELVDALKYGKKLVGIKGLWYKKSGKIYFNEIRPQINLDDIPDLPYNLVDVENYVQMTDYGRSIVIQTSRGCIYSCSFCYNNKFNRSRHRTVSAEKSIKRVKYIKENFGINHLIIHDDSFFANRDVNIAFLEGIKGLNLTWETEGANACLIDKMDEDYIKLLKESGCVKLYIALDSASPRLLKILNKPTSTEQILCVNRKLRDTGIIAVYNFIVGIPTETDEDIKTNIRFAFRLLEENPNAFISGFFSLTIFAGTSLYEEAEKTGKMPKSLEEWGTVQFDYTNSPWIEDKQRDKLRFIYFLTRFMDDKYKIWVRPAFFPFFSIYKHFARFRLKHFWFHMPIELKAYNIMRKLGKL